MAAVDEDELRRRIKRHSLFGPGVDDASLALVLALRDAAVEMVERGATRGDVEAALSESLCWFFDLSWEVIKKSLPKRGPVAITHRRD
ncbi:MAG TPA: hypothetical protein VJ464_16795 [Blastocatellia bacterium]|nr:hypothetical protein [Blastocatellia bacterium]